MEFKEEDVLRAYAVSNGIGWRAQSPEALKFSFHARTSHVSGQNEKQRERKGFLPNFFKESERVRITTYRARFYGLQEQNRQVLPRRRIYPDRIVSHRGKSVLFVIIFLLYKESSFLGVSNTLTSTFCSMKLRETRGGSQE